MVNAIYLVPTYVTNIYFKRIMHYSLNKVKNEDQEDVISREESVFVYERN